MSPTTVRVARREDLVPLVKLLMDDPLGRGRESLSGEHLRDYEQAFEAIASDANNELLVAEDDGGLVGMLQVTYIPGLSRRGAWRAQIESVRVRGDRRRQGIGRTLMRAAIDRARARGCGLVQLTTDLTRKDSHPFYESLGFAHTHAGMKLALQRKSER